MIKTATRQPQTRGDVLWLQIGELLQDLILRVKNAIYTKALYDQLQIEQDKSERLLRNVLPLGIACQAQRDKRVVHSTINRRGSKDSQLR